MVKLNSSRATTGNAPDKGVTVPVEALSKPVPEAPAKAARKPRVKLPEVDFTALTVTETDEPLRSTRASKVDTSPVPGWLRESYETGKAKSVTVTADQAKTLVAMLRTAANRANIGVKILVDDAGNGLQRVRFQGKERRAYTPRAK
jgi:hypothetical protein